VTIGAWIRGTQVASDFIAKNYSPGLAGLLRQPAIVEYLLSELGNLPAGIQQDPFVVEVRAKLQEALLLVQTKDRTPLTPEAVTGLATTMNSLLNSITGGKKES